MESRGRLAAVCLLLIAVAGCSQKDTGGRRIEMSLWYYSPPKSIAGPDDLVTEALVFADEHWSSSLNDSYQDVRDAEVSLNGETLAYDPSHSGYFLRNLEFAPGGDFTLHVVMNGTETYDFAETIPDIRVRGLPAGRDTTISVSDTLRISWTQIGSQPASLDIIRRNQSIENLSELSHLEWAPQSSYRGETLTVEFHFKYSFPSQAPFSNMQYEYLGSYHFTIE